MAHLDSTDQFLTIDPATFTPAVVQALGDVSISDQVQQRAAELADKANEGTITEDERAEYLRYIQADEILTLIKAQAQGLLSSKEA